MKCIVPSYQYFMISKGNRAFITRFKSLRLILLGFFFFCSLALQAQDQMILEDGIISFLSSKKVYVKFKSTKNINPGDTLFFNQNDSLIPVLLVENKSSSSTVCIPLGNTKVKVKDTVIARSRIKLEIKEEDKSESTLPETDEEQQIVNNDPVIKPEEDRTEEVLFKEKVKGRISVATYNNFSDYTKRTRMRYGFSFRGYNLNNSRISVESYITFRHTLNDSIRLANALKVYSLNVKYNFSKDSYITLGRKINQKFSSIGAIDGVQYEKSWGRFSLGAVAGTRPDFQDYSFNPDLLQFGGYISFGSTNPAKFAHTTLGLIEQMNKGNTDRRFVYFQHSSTLAKNLNFFGSMEVDLYQKINTEVKNTPQLTNLYASLRYRFNNKFRLSASYDTRKNIIYYESYKNFIDQLIEDESRQGLRLGFNHRITKKISWAVNGGMRFQTSQKNPSKSLRGHITYSRVPFIKARATLRASFLQTDFLDSQIFGARMSKELVRGKLSADIYYRWVDYKYKIGDRVLHQDIGGVSLSLRIQKQLSLHLFYEGVLDNTNQIYHRFNARIIKRF